MGRRIKRLLSHLLQPRSERRLEAVETLTQHAHQRATEALRQSAAIERRMAALDLETLIANERARDT